jgi:CHAT domain-containing protein
VTGQSATAEVLRKRIGAITLGQVTSQEIAGGETHVYEVAATRGQFVRVSVVELEVDIELRIVEPNGATVSLDTPRRFQGRESICAVTSGDGLLTIEVVADEIVPAGKYELRLDELHAPSPSDLQRNAAEQAYRHALEAPRSSALSELQAALAQWSPLDDARWTSYILCRIGRIQRSQGQLPEALATFDEALRITNQAGDVAGQAFVLNEKAGAIRQLTNPLDAESTYTAALDIRKSLGDNSGVAQILDNLGRIYLDTSYPQKAADRFSEARGLWHAARDKFFEANTLNNLAGARDALGDSTAALQYFEEVLQYCRTTTLCQRLGGGDLAILPHNNIGNIYAARADVEHALAEFDQALLLSRQLKNKRAEALVLNNIGMTYAAMGDLSQALDYLQQSLAINRTINSPRELATSLNNVGYVYGLMGTHAEAVKYLELALPMAQKAGNNKFIAYAITNLGYELVSGGQLQRATELYQQALTVQQNMGDQRSQAVSLDRLGDVTQLKGDHALAGTYYDQALQNWETSGDLQGKALTLYNYARLERERGDLNAAREKVESAISIVESLRTKLSSDQLRRTYFASKQDMYGLDIEVRMQLFKQTGDEMHRAAALAASERARARNLLDLLQDANANVRPGVDLALAKRERELQAQLTATSESLFRQRSLNHNEDAAAVEQRLNELTREYDRLQAQIRTGRPGYADLKQPQPLALPEIQKLLDPDSLLLEYSLGEQRSYVWAVTDRSVTSYELPGRAVIEKSSAALRENIIVGDHARPQETPVDFLNRRAKAVAELEPSAIAVSDAILRPAAAEITQAKRLVIVADGALNYIPFEYLPLPSPTNKAISTTSRGRSKPPVFESLTVSKEVIYQPSLSALALIRSTTRPAASKEVAVLANPVFSSTDRRVRSTSSVAAAKPVGPAPTAKNQDLTRSLRDFTSDQVGDVLVPLTDSGKEADDIIASAPAGSSLKIVDFDANLTRATSPELAQYRTVHFATHAILNTRHPELSGIVLSLVDRQGTPQPGFLNLYAIYDLRLPVELVVLSACQTGIGQEVRGEGLIGLTRGFMYAGAARLVVSLWKVSDDATAIFMRHFYRHLLRERLTAAAALRATRADMMKERIQLRAPYYWAGFVLQGDWR